MRNRPSVNRRRTALPVAAQQPPTPLPPNWLGDTLEPFLVSGGATFYITTLAPEVPFEPAPAGVQLVCSVYVPTGKVGFLKELRVAPFMPTMLADPWTTTGAANLTTSWREFDSVADGPVRPGGTNGVWTTPFGWESYFDSVDCGEQPPQWTWQLRLVKGNVARIRADMGPFSFADPETWYLQPNIAVPLFAYRSGIPGAAPSGFWGPQRMQVLQGDKLSTHVLVPQDHTLCLFTQWTQLAFQPRAVVDDTIVPYGEEVFPLLPSFGQLHGYMQASDRVTSQENAKFGWGG